jgi:hypothetical protein
VYQAGDLDVAQDVDPVAGLGVARGAGTSGFVGDVVIEMPAQSARSTPILGRPIRAEGG